MSIALDWRTDFGFDPSTHTYVPGWFVSWLPGTEDVVTVTPQPNAADLTVVQFQLKSEANDPAVTWWKGLKIVGPNQEEIGISDTQDSTHDGEIIEFQASSMTADTLQLWKAKGFGVHTPMYELPLAELTVCGGYRFVFLWFRDSFRST